MGIPFNVFILLYTLNIIIIMIPISFIIIDYPGRKNFETESG